MQNSADTTAAPRRIALVTGASRGLGRSMALHLAAAGVDVVGTYRERADEADVVARAVETRGGRALMLPLDVARSETFADFTATLAAALPARFGRPTLDYLVHNAGHALHAPVAETREADFDRIVAVHLKAPFFLTQHLLAHLADGGRILLVSTGLARFTLPGYAAYAAAKGGVEVLARYLAQELGARRVTVNVIAPGATATDFGGGAVRDVPVLNQQIARTVALGRVGAADDVGAAVTALLSDGLGWMNGARVDVSGGQNL
jgi:NAD(P)-dependent dehydrogenase (short-subunit alcohol dehydrogenase family)